MWLWFTIFFKLIQFDIFNTFYNPTQWTCGFAYSVFAPKFSQCIAMAMLTFLLYKVQAKIYVCKTLLKFNLCFHEPFIQFLYNLFSSMLKIQAVPSLQKYLTSTTQGPLCYAVFGCGKGCYLVKLCNDIWQYTDFSHVLHLKMISLE